MATALDPTPSDAAGRQRAFTTSLVAWCAGMVVLIGGGAAVGIAAATGSWADGVVVGGFLSVFIAPAIGGLLAGVLFVDREERAAAARHRPVPAPARDAIAAVPDRADLDEARAA